MDFFIDDTYSRRPDNFEIEQMWDDVAIDCARETSPEIQHLVDVVSKRLSSGNALAAECMLSKNKTLGWFAGRNRLADANFAYEIFNDETVLTALGEPGLRPTASPILNARKEAVQSERREIAQAPLDGTAVALRISSPILLQDGLGFEMMDPFEAVGTLASSTYYGGADHKPAEQSDKDAMELALGVADTAFGMRFAETIAYVSWEPWAPWFKGGGWDTSWVFIDKRTRRMTIILVTDTD